jgi:L-threonylcarbamoyladenylate synthase
MDKIQQAIHALTHGQIIAYPTESTWGLGVDPYQAHAVKQLNHIKKRPDNKSFIILISAIERVEKWIDQSQLPADIDLAQGWPGPLTKVVPASKHCPKWLTYNNKVALRISAHPVTQQLCQAYAKPIISTSANQSGMPPLDCIEAIQATFGTAVASYIPGSPGGQPPTTIIDIQSGKRIR